MATTWVGTGKPAFEVKTDADVSVLTIAAGDITYNPVYNRIGVKKIKEDVIMANGDEERYGAGLQYFGEMYFGKGMLTQAVINKFEEINEYDGMHGYDVYITPRSDKLTLTGKCIIDIDISYPDDRTTQGAVVKITWRLKDLTDNYL